MELGVDFAFLGDDMGFKGHGYVSPQDFRELGFPYYRRIVDSLPVPVFLGILRLHSRLYSHGH